MSQQNFVKISSFFLLFLHHFAHFAKIAITRVCVCFDLAEIRHTYWGSKGKYQH